jgi:methyl-accepting chemotaxis protein
MAMMLQQTSNVDELRQKLNAKEQEARKALEELKGLSTGSSAQDLQNMITDFDAAFDVHDQVVKALNEQKMDVAIATLNEKLLPKLSQLGERGRQLVDAQARQLSVVGQEAESARSISFLSMLTLGLLSVIVGLAAVFSVRKIQTVLRQSVADLNENARRLANTAGRVSASSQSVSHAASEQAASLEETSASTEEIHSMTKRNAENAESATRKTNEASATIHEANQALAQMVNSMNEITTSSNKISKIIKVIDDIAFQTNILALNAAVEAARAGEAGMGFAVVADEVRNLAQRSAKSAKETAFKIEDAISKSQRGVEISARVATSFSQIAGKTREVDQFVAEIALASNEQSQGIQQVSIAVSQMDKITQSNAAAAEEAASASEELNSQVGSVGQTVAELEQLVGGATDAGKPAPAEATHRFGSTAGSHSHARKTSPFAGAAPVRPVTPRSSGANGHAGQRAGLPLPGEDAFKDF